MNNAQRVIAIVAALLFGLSLVFAPWRIEREATVINGRAVIAAKSFVRTSPIWEAPGFGDVQRLDLGILAAEWVGIAVIGGVLFLICKSNQSGPSKP